MGTLQYEVSFSCCLLGEIFAEDDGTTEIKISPLLCATVYQLSIVANTASGSSPATDFIFTTEKSPGESSYLTSVFFQLMPYEACLCP